MNTVSVPTTIFTIATGSRLGGHCTCIAVSVEQLVDEINSTLECNEEMTAHIIEEYNETSKAMGRPSFDGSMDDFDFEFILKHDDQTDKGGWGWSFDYTNMMGNEDHQYLNISVHKWSNTYFETQG